MISVRTGDRNADEGRSADEDRERLLAVFADEVYGRPPIGPVPLRWELLRQTPGPAGSTRYQFRLTLTGPCAEHSLTVLAQVPGADPAGERAGAPAFLGLNFLGNHTTTADPAVLAPGDAHDGAPALHYDGKPDAADGPPPRSAKADSQAWDLVADAGFASLTVCYLELGPDTPRIFDVGLHPALSRTRTESREPDTWGAISLWAWTLSRLQDALEQGMVPGIDPARVIVHGHSRLGKTALWAAAQDARFSAAISNNSGCMGAAIDRGVGESHEVITGAFPHWFTPGFTALIARGGTPSADQDAMMSCIAPRGLYVASASEDLHADPEGEFLGWLGAASAWTGRTEGIAFPAPGGAAEVPGSPLAYHLRPGEHTVERFDWQRWLDVAGRWAAR